MKALFVLPQSSFDLIYGREIHDQIAALADVYAPRTDIDGLKADASVLASAEAIFSGWGCPEMDAAFLAQAPRLKAVFYGAGSIRGFVTDAFWDRGIVVTSAYAANAVPVAEYTLSQILFCLKQGWRYALNIKNGGPWRPEGFLPLRGAYGSTVGIISLGMIGRLVCRLLKPFDLKAIAYDPFVSPADAAALGVELCSLDDVFGRADVVSLHTPWLKETENMIAGSHFAAMKPKAAFINTARGAIVREREMIDVLRNRPDLTAVLDVTYPEPPAGDSPLRTLPNVVLTPHIAGSMEGECRRMGDYMLAELKRYLRGEQLQWAISREKAATLA